MWSKEEGLWSCMRLYRKVRLLEGVIGLCEASEAVWSGGYVDDGMGCSISLQKWSASDPFSGGMVYLRGGSKPQSLPYKVILG